MNKGIYAIICKVNGKMYIGYSFDFRGRRRTHWTQMNQNKYKGRNDQLQNDWNLYGKENFKFVVIEEVNTDSVDVMLQKEEDYIIRFGSFFEDKGYNISLPVSKQYRKGFIEKHGLDFLKELVYSNDDLLIKDDYRQTILRKIYQINKDGEVVRIWNNINLIKEHYSLSAKSLEKIFYLSNRGKDRVTKVWRGFVWVYEDKYDCNFNYSEVFKRKPKDKKEKPFIDKKRKLITPLHSKKISLQNTETGEIWNFDSIKQAERVLCFKLQPLLKGYKAKGGGKIVNVTQWRGWKIYKEIV